MSVFSHIISTEHSGSSAFGSADDYLKELMKQVEIIGGGILGLAIGYELSISHPNFKITLFEKEGGLGKHQSGNNSGVLHCGLYYQPGSLEAKLAVDGIREMIAFCEKNHTNHEVCGKIVVASDDREIGFLDNLADRGAKNGLNGLKFLSPEELSTFQCLALRSICEGF